MALEGLRRLARSAFPSRDLPRQLDAAHKQLLIANERQTATTQSMISQMAHSLGLVANEVNAALNTVLPQYDKIAALEAKFDALQVQVGLIASQIGTANSKLDITQAVAADTANQLVSATVPPQLDQLVLLLGSIANEVNATVNAVLPQSDKIATLETKFDALQARVGLVASQIDSANAKLDDARAMVADTANQLTNAAVPPQLDQMVLMLGSIANEVNATINAVLPQREQIAALDVQVGSTRDHLALVAAKMDATQRSMSAVQTQLIDTARLLDSAQEPPQFAELAAKLGQVANEVNATLKAILGQQVPTPRQIDEMIERRGSVDRQMTGQIAAAIGRVANEVNATLNAVLPQQSDLKSLGLRLDGLTQSLAAEAERSAAQSSLGARNISALLLRAGRPQAADKPAVAAPRPAPSLDQQMASFKKVAPHNFAAWHKAYKAGIAEGMRTTDGNLSHDGHIGANLFRMFLNIHARGRILDIGCGPLPVPAYLTDWPMDELAGIDPQLPPTPHPFSFVQTFAETIPWSDHSFETVVIATSLDHVFLLDRSLAEVKRVLVPGGRLLLWSGMFDDTPPYNPYGPPIIPSDAYHLFHPGRNWFYKLLVRDYRLIERLPTVASAEFLAFEVIGQK